MKNKRRGLSYQHVEFFTLRRGIEMSWTHLHKSIPECHKLLGVNVKQKHLYGSCVELPCSSFRSVRLPNLDEEAKDGSGASVCVSRPHLAGEEPHTAAGGRLRSQEAGESFFSLGSHGTHQPHLPPHRKHFILVPLRLNKVADAFFYLSMKRPQAVKSYRRWSFVVFFWRT